MSEQAKKRGLFYIRTYGCQMNERDTQSVAAHMIAEGWEQAESMDEADVILFNTCSVRDQAERKALGKMGMTAVMKQDRPDLVLGVMGCMAQSRGAELLKRVPALDLVVGTQQFHRVPKMVGALVSASAERDQIVAVDDDPEGLSKLARHLPAAAPVSGFVSIMRGCNQRCSFCIVPSTRGEEQSRPIEEITEEVERLVGAGMKEVTLLGQIVTSYGVKEYGSRGRMPFVRLVEKLHEIEGLERIRFTSPHPKGLRVELMDAFHDLPKLCEHMHLPLQSGSTKILKRMRRTYTQELFLKKVGLLRERVPNIAITTDIIVGFPGETDQDFEETVKVVKEADFDNAFVFRYSKRRDTPAATMDGQLSEEVKQERNQILLSLLEEQALVHNQKLVGSVEEVLVEGPSKRNPDRLSGRTRTNKIVVYPGAPRHIGQVLPIRIDRAMPFTLYGDPVILE
jgi:tRNA-2-methylthio-N6-dimethylallyladenosine synthase